MPSELNLQLAKKLGYSVYHYDKGPADTCYYSLQDSHGEPVVSVFKEGERKTEDAAWGDCPNFMDNIPLLLEIISNRNFVITHGPATASTDSEIVYSVDIEPYEWQGKIPKPFSQGDDLGETILRAILQVDFDIEKQNQQAQRYRDQIKRLQGELAKLLEGATSD